MMESIRSKSERTGSSDSGSCTTRRIRSSSIASPSSLTDPTTPHRNFDHGRLGTGFSILKPPRSQAPRAPLTKILALPPWLQDAVTELDASHPLRAVFPAPRDVSDPSIFECSLDSSPDPSISQYANPNIDVNRSLYSPSTSRIQPGTCQLDSDTSDELRPFPPNNPLYHNPLLHLRCGPPTPSVSALPQLEMTLPAITIPYPSPSRRIATANTAHIFDLETVPLSASSLNHNPPDRVSPAPPRNLEYDGVFRYNPSQVDSTTAPPSFQPFVFERPIRVYFDSPTEDPVGSDPLEPDDHDPFRLDPDECKNLDFRWAPFDPQTGTLREPMGIEAETNTPLPAPDEVLTSDGSNHSLAHPFAPPRSVSIVISRILDPTI